MDIVKQYEELLKIDPGSIAFAPLAEELCYRGFWEEALKVCRQGLTYHPHHLRGRVLLGWALKELGEHEEAEQVLVGVEGEIQKNALLFRLLAELARKGGVPGRAERLMLIHQNLQPGERERGFPAEREGEPASRPEPPTAAVPAEPPPVSPAQVPPIAPPALSAEPPIEPPGEMATVPPAAPQATPPQGPPEAAPAEPVAEGPTVSPKEEAAGFLSRLLDRYEALPAKSAAEQQLFSEEDRLTLSRILKNLRH